MDKGGQSELLAGFIATLTADGGPQPVNGPADVAAASAGLSASAVGWAVGVSSRCADAVRTAMGAQGAWLPEDETRRAIEMSVLAMLRHVAHGVPAFLFLIAFQKVRVPRTYKNPDYIVAFF